MFPSHIFPFANTFMPAPCPTVNPLTLAHRRRRDVTSHLPRVKRGGHAVVWGETCCYDNDSSADSAPAACARSCLLESVLALSAHAKRKMFSTIHSNNTVRYVCVSATYCTVRIFPLLDMNLLSVFKLLGRLLFSARTVENERK